MLNPDSSPHRPLLQEASKEPLEGSLGSFLRLAIFPKPYGLGFRATLRGFASLSIDFVLSKRALNKRNSGPQELDLAQPALLVSLESADEPRSEAIQGFRIMGERV